MHNCQHYYKGREITMILNKKIIPSLVAIISIAGISACTIQNVPATDTFNPKNSRLEVIKKRGKLICGVSGKNIGFSYINSKGEYKGFDVDICRAVATAIFNDRKKVEFRNVSTQERFNALASGEIDLLASTTTWTLSRDADMKVSFAPISFYDGQGLMARRDLGIDRLEDLEDKTICVLFGTTSLLNLSDRLREKGINYTQVAIGDVNRLYQAYQEGRCEAISIDKSQLVARRQRFIEPQNHIIFKDTLSKEPLAPAVIDGDTVWFDVVRWSLFSLIQAEEFGITSSNIDRFTTTADPAIMRFLGKSNSLGKNLGLTNDFAPRIVKQVGNYGEIYDRNISPLGLDRGVNELWTNGGLMYSPPFR